MVLPHILPRRYMLFEKYLQYLLKTERLTGKSSNPCNSTKFDDDLDGWVISRPRPLNKVAFVATNGNYQGSYSVVKEITVHIAHKF